MKINYKSSLNQRYWEYQQSQYPAWQEFFDGPNAQRGRPPVFLKREAWRNIIVSPDASQKEIDRLVAMVPVDERHKWFGSMNSSQALAQSVLGNLAVYGVLDCLAELQDDEGEALFGDAQISSEDFLMERKIDYLGEPRPTSLDGYVSGNYRVAVECKFTEPDIGTCSRPLLRPSDSNYESDRCDGTYVRQCKRNKRCSLTEIGVKYWEYASELFTWDINVDLSPCPMYRNYQLVRNILAAGVKPDGNVSPDNGHAVLIYDERNPVFPDKGKGLIAYFEMRLALREPTMLRKCSWQRIINHLRNEGVLPWLTEQLELKYGL